MRHLKAGRKLNRDSEHRQALFRNMIQSVLRHGSVITSVAKAKECAGKVDKVITLAKRAERKVEEMTAKMKKDVNEQVTPELQQQIDKRAQAIRVNYLRRVLSKIQDVQLTHKLFKEIAPLFKERKGGYTSVLRYNQFRPGDNSPRAVLRLIEIPQQDKQRKAEHKEKMRKQRENKKEKAQKEKAKAKQEA
jgi:large subunit ribosomal protein L17